MSELQEFAEGISMIDGAPVRMLGVSLPTRMIIVKLSDGSLWVNSPVFDAQFDLQIRTDHTGHKDRRNDRSKDSEKDD